MINKLKTFLNFIFGLIYLVNERNDQAIGCFKKCLIQSPNSKIVFDCNKYIGVAYCYKEDYKNARIFLDRSIGLIGKNLLDTELNFFLALVLQSENEINRAHELLSLALKNYQKTALVSKSEIENRMTALGLYLKKRGDKP
jgi:tetratricopeptide (TPR) repeat protein